MVAGHHSCSLCRCTGFKPEAPRQLELGWSLVKAEDIKPGMVVMIVTRAYQDGTFIREERWGKVGEATRDPHFAHTYWLTMEFREGWPSWAYLSFKVEDDLIVRPS